MAECVDRIAAEATKTRIRSISVVYDPESMSHQVVETPKVKRVVFATLARVRSDHPVVTSEALGWGIEVPQESAGGAYSALLHSEVEPWLSDLAQTCEECGYCLNAAWSAYTVAEQCLRLRPEIRSKSVLFLLPGFVAVASLGAKRTFRSWTGDISENEWKSVYASIGDGDARSAGALAGAEPKRGGLVVVTDGNPRGVFPLWDDFSSAGRITAVVDMEEYAVAAARLPRSHTANLVTSFPRKLEVNGYLTAISVVMFVASAVLVLFLAADSHRLSLDRNAANGRLAEARSHLDMLTSNQRVMAALREGAPEVYGSPSANVHLALGAVTNAMPDSLTLTSFAIQRTGKFEIGAFAIANGFDPEPARLGFVRAGFIPDNTGGWSYDPKAGSLRMHGSFSEVSP